MIHAQGPGQSDPQFLDCILEGFGLGYAGSEGKAYLKMMLTKPVQHIDLQRVKSSLTSSHKQAYWIHG